MRAVPFDVGMIHYASDTPYTRTRTLGGRGLSLDGVEATYAALIAVVRRIAVVEASRGQRQKGDGGGPRHSYAAAAAGLGD